MQNQWNDQEAAQFINDPVALRAYTSRLLGREPALVQHGGGNTSVKVQRKNIFGESENILFVKGSGWDLATIEPKGFAPVKMEILLRLAQLETLSDTEMVREQRMAMTDPSAPSASVEAILHAVIPFQFVDHTHSDAVVSLTNTPDGANLIRQVFGPRILIIPYIMPGFDLARAVVKQTRDLNWSQYDAMVLLNHGVFTFADNARSAYENMIAIVSKAETFLDLKCAGMTALKLETAKSENLPTALEMAELRKQLGLKMQKPILLQLDSSDEAVGFAAWEKAREVSHRGTVTPDHVIHIKSRPLVISPRPKSPSTVHENFSSAKMDLDNYARESNAYFMRHKEPGLTELDTCPRWIIWPGCGTLSVAATAKALRITNDIVKHTRRCMQWSEALGGYRPVSENDLFAVEYWELEQAKLKVGATKLALQGKIAVVTGAASGIGFAIANELRAQGAVVAALDLNPQVVEKFGPGNSHGNSSDNSLGIICDVRSEASLQNAFTQVAHRFGGVDILVANAGTFPAGQALDKLSEADWTATLDVNLTGHWRTLKTATPLLKLGFDPSIIIIGSKNVSAPGPGAAAYSAAKAGLTQLARVAALELAPHGIRVNTIHPDAVFDTGIWSVEVLLNRSENYGLTVEQYKRKNLLKTEITSADVARLVSAMTSPAFAKTTGAQIPIDGGNDRVV